MRRVLAAAAAIALSMTLASPAAAAEYPENWKNCRPNNAGSTMLCDALVTLKSTDAGTARNQCRYAIARQAYAFGVPSPTADAAIVQKRPHKRFWCKVFLSFRIPTP